MEVAEIDGIDVKKMAHQIWPTFLKKNINDDGTQKWRHQNVWTKMACTFFLDRTIEGLK